ncbi:MAG: LysM peptidoglycan-binding domain-containing protein [Armatimonadota bacterium]
MAAGSSYHDHVSISHNTIPLQIWHSIQLALHILFFGAILLAAGYIISNPLMKTPDTDKVIITVQPGDTLWKLAQNYGDSNQYILGRVNEISRLNKLEEGQALSEGQTLIIPVAAHNAQLRFGDRYAAKRIAD